MGRNGTLDHARLIAAFGIVFFHAGAPGAAIGYAALPFFLILLVVLAAPGAARMDFADFAGIRARRLLLPWLVWSAAYGALKLAELAVTGAAFGTEFAPWMMLTGPALHLWFLPFALVACLLVHPVVRLGDRLSAGGRAALAGVLLIGALFALALGQGAAFPTPFAQWLYALPAVFLGLAIALGIGRLRWLGGVTAILALAALAAGWTAGLMQLVLACGALALCMALPRPGTGVSQQAGAAALGVYLAHPLVLSVLGRASGLPHDTLAMAVVACAGALALTLVLSQMPTWACALSRKPRAAPQAAGMANTSA